MRPDRFLAPALLLATSLAHAQLMPADPDWKEVEAPAPAAAFSLDGLVPLELPRTNLRFGVVPSSVNVGSDSIVRYILVARSDSGVVNGLYEGIRCGTGEVKLYARHNPGSGWVILKDAQWLPLQDAKPPRHSLAIARNGACIGHGVNHSADRIIRDLRSPGTRLDRPQ